MARVHKAREKLLKLSRLQFAELSTDVYDELQRRQGLSYEPQDFLAPRSNFHPKRNQARQKLSTLPGSRFRDLASDIQYEIERRHEEIGIAPHEIGQPQGVQDHDHTMGHAVDVPSHLGENGAIERGLNGDQSYDTSNQSYDNYGVAVDAVPSIHVDDSHAKNDSRGHERAPSQLSQRSFPESSTLQSKTLIPNKSTLVEETDSEEDEDDHPDYSHLTSTQPLHARNVSQTSSEHSQQIGNKTPTYEIPSREARDESHSFHPETIHPEDVDSTKEIHSPDLDDDELLGGSTTQVGYTHEPTPSFEPGFESRSQPKSISADSEDLQCKLADAENMSKSLMEENEQLHEFIKALETEKKKLVDTCNAQVEALEEEKTQLREIIGSREGDLEDLRGRHETLVDKQSNLDDAHTSLATRVSSLEAELELKEVELDKLQGELQQVHIEHKNELEGVRKEVKEQKLVSGGVGAAAGAVAGIGAGRFDYDRLPSISPDTSIDKSMPAVEDMDNEAILNLQNQLREQREKTSEVKKQAAVFLTEMKSLAAKSHDHELARKEVNELKAEIEQWKARYSKTKATVRSLRSSVYGTSGIVQPAIESTNPFVDEVHGLVEDVSLTKFQLAMDEYLLKSRDIGGDHSELLQHLHRVIVATRKVTDDSNDVSTEGGARDYRTPLLSNLSSIVSKTANQLITCTKNHATSSGLLPIYLLDASVANLACAVIELVKVAKIRSESGEKRALTREGLGLALGGGSGTAHASTSSRHASVSTASGPSSGLSGLSGPSGPSASTVSFRAPSGLSAHSGGVSFDSYPLSPSSLTDGLPPIQPHVQSRSGSFSSTEGTPLESPVKTVSAKGNSRLRTLRLVSAPSSLRDKNKKRDGEESHEVSESDKHEESHSTRSHSTRSPSVADLNVPKVRGRGVTEESVGPRDVGPRDVGPRDVDVGPRDVSNSTIKPSESVHSTESVHSAQSAQTHATDSTKPLSAHQSHQTDSEPLSFSDKNERSIDHSMDKSVNYSMDKSLDKSMDKSESEDYSVDQSKSDKSLDKSISADKSESEPKNKDSSTSGFGVFGAAVGAITTGVAALSFGQKKKDSSKGPEDEGDAELDFQPRDLDAEFKPRDLDAELDFQPRDLDELHFQPRDLDAVKKPRASILNFNTEPRPLDQGRLLEKAREMNSAREGIEEESEGEGDEIGQEDHTAKESSIRHSSVQKESESSAGQSPVQSSHETTSHATSQFTPGQNMYSGSSKDYFDSHAYGEDGPGESEFHDGPVHEIQRYDYVTAQEVRAEEKRVEEERAAEKRAAEERAARVEEERLEEERLEEERQARAEQVRAEQQKQAEEEARAEQQAQEARAEEERVEKLRAEKEAAEEEAAQQAQKAQQAERMQFEARAEQLRAEALRAKEARAEEARAKARALEHDNDYAHVKPVEPVGRGIEADTPLSNDLSTAAMAATAVVGATMAGTGVASVLDKSYASPAVSSPAMDSPATTMSSPGAFHPQESFDPQATFELPTALREAVSQSPDVSHVSNMSSSQDDTTEVTQMSDDGGDVKARDKTQEDYDTLLGGDDQYDAENYDAEREYDTPLTHSVTSVQDAPLPRESLTSEISEVEDESVKAYEKAYEKGYESKSYESKGYESAKAYESVPKAAAYESAPKAHAEVESSEEEEDSEEEDSDEEDSEEDDEESEEESEDEQVIAADLGIYLPKAVKFDGEDPDNTVEDLQYYLEEQCVEVIEAIQNLLTAIKGNSNMIAISAHSRAICKVVLCMVDATSQSMAQTRNHLLKENGTWICQDLRACTDRMKMIFKDDKFVKPGVEYPPKQFKQRLAGLSFDLTKCTKELVKTVEEVSLQTEIGEIDRQIAHN
ncbi:Protein SPA2 [Yarrowia sp. C11]|nr:Protein SPA2 [Yarrowia sp. C11]